MAAYSIAYKFKSLIYNNSDMQEGFLSSASLYFGGNKQTKKVSSFCPFLIVLEADVNILYTIFVNQ